jgi:hypothetical protein
MAIEIMIGLYPHLGTAVGPEAILLRQPYGLAASVSKIDEKAMILSLAVRCFQCGRKKDGMILDDIG